MYNPYSLEGRTILVTGASSGIGKVTAIECAKMGATVILTGRNEERLNETLAGLDNVGKEHKAIVADLSVPEELEKVVTVAEKINGLVLCAGAIKTLPFNFCKRASVDKIFEVNFFAPMEILRLFAKKKQLTDSASVVIVSSIGGVYTHVSGNCVYDATKAAINSIMKSAARELAPKKIRVNSVCPGMVNTPLINLDALTAEQFEADKAAYPLKRYGDPIDIAHGIIYLLSNAASWVTGHSLVIDGGYTI